METAYRRTPRSLGLVDRADPIAEIVARKIIEIGATGVRDPDKIAMIAAHTAVLHRRGRRKTRVDALFSPVSK